MRDLDQIIIVVFVLNCSLLGNYVLILDYTVKLSIYFFAVNT